jgi:hypothetical protein
MVYFEQLQSRFVTRKSYVCGAQPARSVDTTVERKTTFIACLLILEKLFEDGCVTVVGVSCCVQERDRPVFSFLPKFAEKLRGTRLPQFRSVLLSKFRPSLHLVSVPVAKSIGRGDLSQPLINVSILFAQASWPQTVDENPPPISSLWFLIYSFQFDHDVLPQLDRMS